MYFDKCKTAEEGKALYRELVRKYHPDNGGDTVTMGNINDEFSVWWKAHKNIHATQDGKTYTKETDETAQEFIDILDKLSKIPGIIVDLCGSWLWISGNTYPHREYLAECGCHWSKGKKKWFWAADVKQKSGKGFLSESDITLRYGRKRMDVQFNPTLGIQ